jgi:hypothetical protein
MDSVILQGANHLEAGAVTHMGQTRIAMPAEVALQYPSVVRSVKERAPRLEFADTIWRFFGVKLSHAPVVQILTASHGVGEMDPPVIAVIDVGERGCDTAFGHHSVRLAEQRFADDSDLDAGRSSFDCGPKARPASTDH